MAHEIDDEPLVRIVARRVLRRMRADAETPEFGRLLFFQASGAAGDALVAFALAGSLFFDVPETDARDRVGAYLLLTVAPFAVVAPLLARVLDRHRGSLKWAMVVAALGRAGFAFGLSGELDSLFLFPYAFGILVLSRATTVVRGAVLPQLVPEGRTLVNANATISKMNAIAGIVIALPGVMLIKYPGVRTELFFCALVYAAGAVAAFRLPTLRGHRKLDERLGARVHARRASIRRAVVSAGGMKFLTGFLILHLAFALRNEGIGSLGLATLVGAAAFGSLIGALLAPRLRKRLREEGIIVAGLIFAGISGLVVGRWFSLVSAGVLLFAFSISQGAAKLSFDSIVQRDLPEGARGWAFARFEAALQLAWVAGAAVPLPWSIPGGPGVFASGVGANALAILFLAGGRRARTSQREIASDQRVESGD